MLQDVRAWSVMRCRRVVPDQRGPAQGLGPGVQDAGRSRAGRGSRSPGRGPSFGRIGLGKGGRKAGQTVHTSRSWGPVGGERPETEPLGAKPPGSEEGRRRTPETEQIRAHAEGSGSACAETPGIRSKSRPRSDSGPRGRRNARFGRSPARPRRPRPPFPSRTCPDSPPGPKVARTHRHKTGLNELRHRRQKARVLGLSTYRHPQRPLTPERPARPDEHAPPAQPVDEIGLDAAVGQMGPDEVGV